MRDFLGYGKDKPIFKWPNNARLAINFIINYEEGAELSIGNNDKISETQGGEFPLSKKAEGMRQLSMESLYEFGARSGIWHLLELFDEFNIPLTFFATGLALSLNPPLCKTLKNSPHEIAGHGWRWIDYEQLKREEEKQHIAQTIQFVRDTLHYKIRGWYTGRKSQNTRSLLLESKQFIYDSDSYGDDLPYYHEDTRHLIIPYTLDCNDFRFSTTPGFSSSEDFYLHLMNAFNYAYHHPRPQLLSIALHPRISGRAARMMAIKRFLQAITQQPNIWFTRRIDIARHWNSLF